MGREPMPFVPSVDTALNDHLGEHNVANPGVLDHLMFAQLPHAFSSHD